MADKALKQQLERAAALSVPIRHALYTHVASQPGEVSRQQAASAVGISRALAAFHLDKLVAAGLLEASYRRLSGRTGPGSGRTSKLYRRGETPLEVSLPGRRYDLAGCLLARAVADAGTDAAVALTAAAEDEGRRLGAQARERGGAEADPSALRRGLMQTLAASGFEPREDEQGRVLLGNCPFASLAHESPRLICGMNLALCRGLAEGLSGGDLDARLEPGPGRCCVVFGSR
jgi:predicted ArsR family transcriptional regulator